MICGAAFGLFAASLLRSAWIKEVFQPYRVKCRPVCCRHSVRGPRAPLYFFVWAKIVNSRQEKLTTIGLGLVHNALSRRNWLKVYQRHQSLSPRAHHLVAPWANLKMPRLRRNPRGLFANGTFHRQGVQLDSCCGHLIRSTIPQSHLLPLAVSISGIICKTMIQDRLLRL
jgi:hypothetical protein